jgi:hypothetical protein
LPDRRTLHSQAMGASRQASSIRFSQEGLDVILPDYASNYSKCKVR